MQVERWHMRANDMRNNVATALPDAARTLLS